MNDAKRVQWIQSCEATFRSMVVGLSWDPADEGDAECVDALQDMVDEWVEAQEA